MALQYYAETRIVAKKWAMIDSSKCLSCPPLLYFCMCLDQSVLAGQQTGSEQTARGSDKGRQPEK